MKEVKKNVKKVIISLLVLSFMVTLLTRGNMASAKTISKTYSVSPTSTARVAIVNVNSNNKVTVTFSAYPDSASNVSRVSIYKNSGFTGTAVTTQTFNSANKHDATFSLPAGATYYAKIESATGNSFTGKFIATY